MYSDSDIIDYLSNLDVFSSISEDLRKTKIKYAIELDDLGDIDGDDEIAYTYEFNGIKMICISRKIPLDCMVLAFAHELAHLYIETKGLLYLKVTRNAKPGLEIITQEINNVISHPYVLSKVDSIGLNNSLHFYRLEKLIYNFDKSVEFIYNSTQFSEDEKKYRLFTIGATFYDIFSTMPEKQNIVSGLVRKNDFVYRSFIASIEKLPLIQFDSPLEVQKGYAIGFINSLDIPVDNIILNC